ncbi:MAG: SDR family oxidoreductase [Acidimicrobiia bacterium]|nr:SDR family oxidoreductase [Acidimicrobiia bacterium]
MSGTVLVAGASGLVGAAAVDAFLEGGWQVTAVSRRRPEVDSDRPFRHLPLDLTDRDECGRALRATGPVSHVVYAAVQERPGLVAGWRDRELMELNRQMLANVVDPLGDLGGLRHLSLLQGTKAYGAHLHRIPVPAREDAPRDPHENFYWLQEDLVRERAVAQGWSFTILRPQLIVGPNVGVVMNLPPIIGVYAALRRAEAQPFSFPGGVPYVWEAVDTRLVARVLLWAADAPAAAGETFNVTNGDVFSWRHLWPALADELGVEVGPDEPLSLAEYLPARAEAWDGIVAAHGLRPLPMDALVGESHHYADRCFAHGETTPRNPTFVSTVKLRQAGFGEAMHTEDTFRYWLNRLIERRILPPRGR